MADYPIHEKEKDLEAAKGAAAANASEGVLTDDSSSDEIGRAREIQQRTGILRTMRKGEEWLDAKMGIELQGIDRIHEEHKRPPSIVNIFLMWFSMTMHVGTLPIGVLGPEFGLSLKQSAAAIVAGTALGAVCPAYCGTLGPKVCSRPLLQKGQCTLTPDRLDFAL